MRDRLINIFLLLFFLICYLQWGTDQSGFIFQLEYEIFTNAKGGPDSFLHPFIFIPMLGQFMILFNIFKKQPNKKLTLIGMGLLSILVLVIFLAGILSMNIRIIASTLPFILISVYYLISNKNRRKKEEAINNQRQQSI